MANYDRSIQALSLYRTLSGNELVYWNKTMPTSYALFDAYDIVLSVLWNSYDTSL